MKTQHELLLERVAELRKRGKKHKLDPSGLNSVRFTGPLAGWSDAAILRWYDHTFKASLIKWYVGRRRDY